MMVKTLSLLLTFLSAQVLRADDASDPNVAARIADAKAEIASLPGHPWAGEYFAGDGLGMNLRLWLAPRTGAAFQWHGCLGLYEQNFGTVESNGPYLSIDWKIENDDPYVTDTRYVVTPFRNSIFLVPAHDVHRFCLAARNVSPMPMMVLSSQSPRNQPTASTTRIACRIQEISRLGPDSGEGSFSKRT